MQEIFVKLKAMRPKGMDFGTERTRTILDRLQSPDKGLKIIHIAGTNGKGSTAEYITDILISAGKKTGTFTSPEVYSYFEQFRIDGQPIEEGFLAECFTKADNAARGLNATAFEIETAGVLYAFFASGCEYAVVECGLGGLLDATNAIAKKEVAVITSVSLEHTAVLGGTVKEICRHKAGIIKDCPAVVCSLQSNEAAEYFANLGAISAPPADYNLKIQGSAQPYNAGTAAKVAELLGIDKAAIKAGIENTFLAGRLEIIKKDRTYILDGAHNPQSFENLKLFLAKFKGRNVTVIYGCLSDKDADSCLEKLADCASGIIAVKPDSYRAMDIDSIFALCKKHFKNAKKADGVCAAIDGADGDAVVVCGSFTILNEARERIQKL